MRHISEVSNCWWLPHAFLIDKYCFSTSTNSFYVKEREIEFGDRSVLYWQGKDYDSLSRKRSGERTTCKACETVLHPKDIDHTTPGMLIEALYIPTISLFLTSTGNEHLQPDWHRKRERWSIVEAILSSMTYGRGSYTFSKSSPVHILAICPW